MRKSSPYWIICFSAHKIWSDSAACMAGRFCHLNSAFLKRGRMWWDLWTVTCVQFDLWTFTSSQWIMLWTVLINVFFHVKLFIGSTRLEIYPSTNVSLLVTCKCFAEKYCFHIWGNTRIFSSTNFSFFFFKFHNYLLCKVGYYWSVDAAKHSLSVRIFMRGIILKKEIYVVCTCVPA